MNSFKLNRVWDPSSETLVIHTLLLGAGAIIGVILLVVRAYTLSIPPPPLPDLLPYLIIRRAWRPEPHERYLYHVGLLLIPSVALVFWYGMLKLKEYAYRELREMNAIKSLAAQSSWAIFLSSAIALAGMALLLMKKIPLAAAGASAMLWFAFSVCSIVYFYRYVARTLAALNDEKTIDARIRTYNRLFVSLLGASTALFSIAALVMISISVNQTKIINFLNDHGLESLLALALVGLIVWFWGRIKNRLPHVWTLPKTRWLEIAAVMIVIPFLLWNPAFKHYFGVDEGTLHHYSFFLGPAHDLLRGKYQLVNTESQYGILLTSGLAFIFKHVIPFSLSYFYTLIMAVSIFYYWMLYFFIRRYTGKVSYAWLGVLCAFSVNILAIGAHKSPFEAYIFPSVTPLRFLFDIPVFILVLQYARTARERYTYAASALCACALFYNFEIGLSLSLSLFVFFLVHLWRQRETTARQCATILARRLAIFVGVGGIIFFAYSSSIYLRSEQWPDWARWLYFVKFYAAGFGALPITRTISPYQVLLLIYAVTSFWTLVEMAYRKVERDTPVVAGMTAYGLLIFHYYLNRSHTNNLFVVSIPAALLMIIIVWRVKSVLAEMVKKKGMPFLFLHTIYVGACMLIIGIYIIQLPTLALIMANRFANPYQNGTHYDWESKATNFSEPYLDPAPFVAAANELSARADTQRRVALLSGYDTLLHFMSSTTNGSNFYNLENQIRTWSDLDAAVVAIKKSQTEYIFMDKKKDFVRDREGFALLYRDYQKFKHEDALNWENTIKLSVQYRALYEKSKQRSNVIELLFAGLRDQYEYSHMAGNLAVYRFKR